MYFDSWRLVTWPSPQTNNHSWQLYHWGRQEEQADRQRSTGNLQDQADIEAWDEMEEELEDFEEEEFYKVEEVEEDVDECFWLVSSISRGSKH